MYQTRNSEDTYISRKQKRTVVHVLNNSQWRFVAISHGRYRGIGHAHLFNMACRSQLLTAAKIYSADFSNRKIRIVYSANISVSGVDAVHPCAVPDRVQLKYLTTTSCYGQRRVAGLQTHGLFTEDEISKRTFCRLKIYNWTFLELPNSNMLLKFLYQLLFSSLVFHYHLNVIWELFHSIIIFIY